MPIEQIAKFVHSQHNKTGTHYIHAHTYGNTHNIYTVHIEQLPRGKFNGR